MQLLRDNLTVSVMFFDVWPVTDLVILIYLFIEWFFVSPFPQLWTSENQADEGETGDGEN